MIWKPGHYKVVAAVLAARVRANLAPARNKSLGSTVDAMIVDGEHEILARSFADAFEARDKKFRRDKFLEACGIEREAT